MIKYLLPILNRFCVLYKDLRIAIPQFPRRESHSLEPKGTGFTDPPAYFNGLLRIKMEDPRVELGLKDFQSSARTGYTNLPKQDTFSCMNQFCYSRNFAGAKNGTRTHIILSSSNCCLCLKYSQRDSNS